MADDIELVIDFDSDTSEPMGPWCWCDVEHTEHELARGKCGHCGKLLIEKWTS